MAEDPFVQLAFKVASGVAQPPLRVSRGACLLYQVTVDNRLQVTVDPRSPTRGQSAFETDLCVFDDISPDTSLPRVVLEFKKSITTHDVLTYSTKARKHKQVYPYLRYGLVASADPTIPRRFFTHNEALDFFLALGGIGPEALTASLGRLVAEEVAASRRLEQIAFGNNAARLFRSEIVFGEDGESMPADSAPKPTAPAEE